MSDQPRQRESSRSAAPRRELSLFDSTSIIVGIIIGSGLYVLPPIVASYARSPAWFFGVWILGGLFAFLGAQCYAELATAYPEDGGDYVYLRHAYGGTAAFLFAWSQLWVIRPGNIGFMAYVFAEYAVRLADVALDRNSVSVEAFAAGAIIVLSVVNLVGVRQGKWTQNVLTAAKVIGILLVFGSGFLHARGAEPAVAAPSGEPNIALAMVLVMFVYGGWNDMAFVAAEVRDPRRNILRALVIGTLAVTGIYLVANAAFVYVLGFDGLRQSSAVAFDVAEVALGSKGGAAVSVVICLSALGAINGMILTGARIYYAVGQEHRSCAWLAHWSQRFGTPARSVIVQCVITLCLLGTLRLLMHAQGDAASVKDSVDRLVYMTAPVFWGFLALVGVGLVILRFREPSRERPFRVRGYPLTPAIFIAGALYMTWASVTHAVANRSWEGIWTLVVLASGLAIAWAERVMRERGPGGG